ncbi:acyl-CoA thioesterase [Chitinophaga nivalis]|uniref:Thioesterase family protein n=1 Tax=Chitinophaga nivalis TaxID=2991709 RepID=A0ABT3IEW8_9BACT|nr:thioesterase family protein [Chitinophaga nivalis]MCW3467806.1 thioesterase family protein [Chitinophaga nivalis]MCW3482502.1 thioesterase family protein [Chitinophaga nivalis]
MARIKIDLPAHFSFSTRIPVRIQDINYGNHVGNDAIVSILHEARIQYLLHTGYKELDHETGTGTIMTDIAVAYKGEGFQGDIFTVEIAASSFHPFGFELFYRITTDRHAQTIVIAEAKTGMLYFDYNTHKMKKLPLEMKTALDTIPA